MPDLAMCRDHGCPSREQCYRYTATPSTQQVYADFERDYDMVVCPEFVEVRVEKEEP